MPSHARAVDATAHPLRVLILVLLVVFAVEGAIMLALPGTAWWPSNAGAASLLDASLLVIVTAPALWLVTVRPLRDLSMARGALLRKVFEAQERERAALGRDLHDEVGQQFTALLVGLRCVEQAGSLEEARRWAEDLRVAAANGLEEVRRLARGLRPAVLESLGLRAAAERLCEDARAAHGLEVHMQAALDSGERIGPSAAITAYRVLQEALTNVARHAGATRVDVTLRMRGERLEVEISDDGRGIESLPRARDGSGLGIQGMRERALALGGTLMIESGAGRGTRVRLMLPRGA